MDIRHWALLALLGCCCVGGARAEDKAAEKLSQDCNRVYAKLCKGFKPGPEMLGRCFDQRPTIQNKIPDKCVEDFQTNVEGYHAAKGSGAAGR